jgi:hypothetical protein
VTLVPEPSFVRAPIKVHAWVVKIAGRTPALTGPLIAHVRSAWNSVEICGASSSVSSQKSPTFGEVGAVACS